MQIKTFSNFEDVEQDYINKAPQIIYKYRGWVDINHKNLLLKNMIWFSHPFDLNDKQDVRPDYVYNKQEIFSEDFFYHICNNMPDWYANLNKKQKEEVAKQQWEKIKLDPDAHFNKNREETLIRKRYDPYGILSTSINCLSVQTWKEYGDEHKGYAIGLKKVELIRDLSCVGELVTYCDKPFPYSFLKNKLEQGLELLLYKRIKYSFEEEFRFATAIIKNNSERLKKFNPMSVSEVVLGHAIPENFEKEILKAVRMQYLNLPIYKTRLTKDGSLEKYEISY